MPEHIEREALLQVLEEVGGCDAPPDSWADGWDKGISEAIKFVKELPAADVVEAVRCNYCKDNATGCVSKGAIWCVRYHAGRPIDGYCSYGERKGGDDNGTY